MKVSKYALGNWKLSCKLPTLTQARKLTKFFANEDRGLLPLAANSFRGLCSKVLQCGVHAASMLYFRRCPMFVNHGWL